MQQVSRRERELGEDHEPWGDHCLALQGMLQTLGPHPHKIGLGGLLGWQPARHAS